MLKKIFKSEKSKRYKVWLKQAEFDIAAAEVSYNNKFFEWACFQSQQAVEKALKAVLVHAGLRPPKMHKLAVLMSECNKANKKFKKTKLGFKDVESFAFIARYPFLIPGENMSPHEAITSKDAQGCIDQAKKFLEKIRKLLGE